METSKQVPRYVGRFAPAPTGPLHFGSLITAVGSYLQARSCQGDWLLRLEDLDQPRAVPGAAESIQQTLGAFGFEWRGPIVRQSQRLPLYQHALDRLQRSQLVYACTCSRAQLANRVASASQANSPSQIASQSEPASDHDIELPYPGFCRTKSYTQNIDCALRFIAAEESVCFSDLLQGAQQQDVSNTCGDFIIRRRDGVFAYHLAVVIDDAEQGVTEVVRGADLLASTPRQILLQRALSLPTPQYAHLPLAVDADGRKLSKSSQSLPINAQQAPRLLWLALNFLQQSPPNPLKLAPLREIWSWATEHWQLKPLQGKTQLLAPSPALGV